MFQIIHSQQGIWTKQKKILNLKISYKLLKITEALLVFYNAIKARIINIDISNTILQTLHYLQTLRTKSCLKISFKDQFQFAIQVFLKRIQSNDHQLLKLEKTRRTRFGQELTVQIQTYKQFSVYLKVLKYTLDFKNLWDSSSY